uniref:Proliferating cell nuclear antigen PCNA N-terminal domain-containing protein n=1 Tax=viral metagenome TaxID=1070528 RepID=A0A6C0CHI0_9ZZZZ
MDAKSSSGDIANHSIHMALREGHILKSVLDCTQVAFGELIFKVTNTGFYMSADNRTTDKKETLLCILTLPRMNFEAWAIPQEVDQDDDAEILIPVDAGNLRSLTNGILKKDMLIIWVDPDDVGTLKLEVQNVDKKRSCSGKVKLIDLSKLSEHVKKPVLPFKYDMNRPNATVSAKEFQKACKAGTQLKAETIKVTGYETCVVFEVGNLEVTRSFPFGVQRDGQKVIYEGEFDVKRNIAAVAKCCTMTTDVRIYCSGRNPMLIAMNAGESGTFDIYLVPNHKG